MIQLTPTRQSVILVGSSVIHVTNGLEIQVTFVANIVNEKSIKTEELIQVAITNTANGATVWLQPVTEEEYNQ